MAKKTSSKGIGLDIAMPIPSPRMNKSAMNEQMRYRAEDDIRTMHRAHEIMQDAKRMANVEKVMQSSMGVMKKMKSMAKAIK